MFDDPTPPAVPRPAAPQAAAPARPRRPWFAGLIGGLLGATLVALAWLSATALNEEPSPSTTIAIASPTTVPPPVLPTSVPTIEIPVLDERPSVADTATEVVPSIVTVEVGNGSGATFQRSATGSGVIIDAAAGHVVTNDHVATAGSTSRVILADGRIYDATLLGTDALTDLAVLDIDASNLTALDWGTTTDLVVGDTAIAVGNPLGLEGGPSLTVGVISAFDREVQTTATDILYGMLQTDAPITSGSSGGALVDASGRLIGITTAVGVSDVGVEGIGFATPVEIVRRIVDELIVDGSVAHAYLGISGRTAFEATTDGGSVPSGVEILTVEPGSAAAAAGLGPGDVLLTVDGVSIGTMEDLIPVLRRLGGGDEIGLKLQRDGGPLTIIVTLGTRVS